MIVFSIILILVAIATPGFLRERRKAVVSHTISMGGMIPPQWINTESASKYLPGVSSIEDAVVFLSKQRTFNENLIPYIVKPEISTNEIEKYRDELQKIMNKPFDGKIPLSSVQDGQTEINLAQVRKERRQKEIEELNTRLFGFPNYDSFLSAESNSSSNDQYLSMRNDEISRIGANIYFTSLDAEENVVNRGKFHKMLEDFFNTNGHLQVRDLLYEGPGTVIITEEVTGWNR